MRHTLFYISHDLLVPPRFFHALLLPFYLLSLVSCCFCFLLKYVIEYNLQNNMQPRRSGHQWVQDVGCWAVYFSILVMVTSVVKLTHPGGEVHSQEKAPINLACGAFSWVMIQKGPAYCGWCQPWAGGPGLYKKAKPVNQKKQSSE